MTGKRLAYAITCAALIGCSGGVEQDQEGASEGVPSPTPSVAVEPKVPVPKGIPEGLSASPEALFCKGSERVAQGVVGQAEPDVYYPEAMNRKLVQHPELREKTGLTSVKTCSEARSFMSDYKDVLQARPELFIADQLDVSPQVFRPESEDVRVQPPEVLPIEAFGENVGEHSDAILNGNSTTQYGAVLISDTAGNWCSGIGVSKFHHLTSAHCFAGTSGWFRGAISRYGCSGGSCFLIPALYSEMWLYLTRNPNYTGGGDYADDVSVVTIYHIYDDGSVTFPDPAAGNALRLWLGSLTANSTVATMYGYGPNAINGTGSFVLRSGTNTISSESAGWFWATRTGNQALCQGDSGGPAVVKTDKATGIASTVSSGPCPAVGGWSLWTRISNQIGWIEGVMAYPNGVGYTCSRFGAGASAYARCW